MTKKKGIIAASLVCTVLAVGSVVAHASTSHLNSRVNHEVLENGTSRFMVHGDGDEPVSLIITRDGTILEGDVASAYASQLGLESKKFIVEAPEGGITQFTSNGDEAVIVSGTFAGGSKESLPEELRSLLESGDIDIVQMIQAPSESPSAKGGVGLEGNKISIFTEDGIILVDAQDTEKLAQFGIKIDQ